MVVVSHLLVRSIVCSFLAVGGPITPQVTDAPLVVISSESRVLCGPGGQLASTVDGPIFIEVVGDVREAATWELTWLVAAIKIILIWQAEEIEPVEEVLASLHDLVVAETFTTLLHAIDDINGSGK